MTQQHSDVTDFFIQARKSSNHSEAPSPNFRGGGVDPPPLKYGHVCSEELGSRFNSVTVGFPHCTENSCLGFPSV